MSNLHQCLCMLPTAVGRSSSGGNLRYIMYFRFNGWRRLHTLSRNMRRQKRSLDRAQHGYDTAVYTETDPPRGSTGPGWVWKLRLPCFSWVTWAYLVLSAYDAEYCQHSVVCRMHMIFAELVQFKLHRRYRANTTQSGSCRSGVS